MLEPEDHSGLFTFLVGMIVVVLAGVGISLLFDRQFRFSRSEVALETVVRTDAEEMGKLIAIKRDLEEQWGRLEHGRQAAELGALTRDVARNERRRVDLGASLATLRSECAQLENAFSAYRLQYRNAAWADAVGESLGVLRVRGGRELRNARITRVTDVGLEIRHEEGLARVQAPDLPAELRARFQWDDAHRVKALADEVRQREEVAKARELAPAPKAVASIGRRVETNSPDPGEVARLRWAVELWQSRVRALRVEHATALSNANRDSKSVPGTLETWSVRGNRLGSDLAKARAALALARGKLAAASPGDPLLRQDPKNE